MSNNSNIITGNYSWISYNESSISSSNSSGSNTPPGGPNGTAPNGTFPGGPNGTSPNGTIPQRPDDNNNNTNSSSSSTIISSIIDGNSTYPDSESEPSVVLLGFSHFNLDNNTNRFSFFIYFVRLLNSILSNTLTFPITVTHSALRFLQNSETIQTTCTLTGDGSESKAQYNCRAQASSSINNIAIDPTKFNFGGKTANLAGITPLASNYLN